MCGIAGVIGIKSRREGEGALRAMLACIVHRGPDEEGVLVIPGLAAGTRRLSIIDLPGGSQPVWNEDRTLAVVFNGEIYNFRALRAELQALGHRFATLSDTEVIVHAYETWRDDCLRHLQGMFAFAVVELPEGRNSPPARVFLARDPLGIKPLYYAATNGIFSFASEVKAFAAGGLMQPALSAEAIASYLLFGAVAEPATIVDAVFSLPPGHSLVIDPAHPVGVPEPKPYWGAQCLRQASHQSDEPPSQRVRALLASAVECHLVADVPVGVFLSSGIDSTTLASLASRAQRGIHTFTLAFPEAEFNEAEIARRTAKTLGTDHREISISATEMLARLDEAISAFDQPTIDGVNTYFVSWAAHQAGLKVALSGLGSDELFGGYTSFRATRRLTRIANIARILPRQLRSFLAGRIAGAEFSRLTPDALRKVSAACADPDSLPHPYFFTRLLFRPQTVASVLHDGDRPWTSMRWFSSLASAVQQSRLTDPFTNVSWLELRSYLLNMLLRDTDSMSMRQSLEVRVPFLDSPLVEYVLSLPESSKYAPNRPKSLLIDAVKDLLPAEAIAQPKRTFTFPWEVWLRGKLAERLAASFADWSPALESHVDSRFARAVWLDFLNGSTTWSRPWSLFVLNEWAKQHVRSHSAASDSRGAASVGAA